MKSFEEVVAFHGHACGGLALGYKVSEYAIKKLNLSFSEDEDVVCIAETDSCMVDAIQMLIGCTAGKGNLIINKWGKSGFSFYRRDNNTSARFVGIPDALPKDPEMMTLREKVFSGKGTPAEQERFHELSHKHVDEILKTPPEKLFKITKVLEYLPEPAKIYNNVICSVCGEQVAEGLAGKIDDKYVCVPCMRKI